MYVTASSTKSNQGNIQIHRVVVFAKIIGNDWCYTVFIFQPFPFRITPLKNLMLLNKQIMKIAQPLQFQHSVHTRSLLVCQSFTLRRCVTEASICTRELLSAAQSPGLCPKAGSSLSYWDKQQRKAKLKLNEVDIFSEPCKVVKAKFSKITPRQYTLRGWPSGTFTWAFIRAPFQNKGTRVWVVKTQK